MHVQEIDVHQLKEKLESSNKPFLLDVREQQEYDLVNLEGKLIPLGQLEDRLNEISDQKEKEVVVYCRSGARSAEACRIMMRNGFTDVSNLEGGINDWAGKIDPSMPIY